MPEPAHALTPGVEGREAAVRGARHVLAAVFFVLSLAFAAAAWSLGDTFYLRLATEALIFAGLAMSVDLLLGYTGLLSLGQALFFGLGAYVSALVLKDVAPSFWLALALALLAATVGGLIGGFIAIRSRGVYFALITFGMAQVVAKVVYNTRALGASDGIIGIPVVSVDFGLFRVDGADAPAFFLLVLAITLVVHLVLAYLVDTPFGRLLVAIGTNEKRVPFLGFDPRRQKLAVYVIAAQVAAISGALYPMLRGFVSPELIFFGVSGNAVITVIVGGVGTLIGPLYGGVLLTTLRSVIGTYTEHHPIVVGALFMLSVVLFPKGLAGYVRPRVERLLETRAARPSRTRPA